MLDATIARFLRDETGATAIEYGMLAALLAVAAISSFTLFGNALSYLFGDSGVGSAGRAIASGANAIR